MEVDTPKKVTLILFVTQMARLFDTIPQNIIQHIKAVYVDEEFLPEATCKDFLQVRHDGSRRILMRLGIILIRSRLIFQDKNLKKNSIRLGTNFVLSLVGQYLIRLV